MEVSESSRSRSKRDADEKTEARESSRINDDRDFDGSDKRKHRSSRSRKHSSQEEAEEHDSGKRKSSGDQDDIRKKSGSSSRAGSGDEDDCDLRRESRSKIPRKSLDDKGNRRTSESYRDRDLESSWRSRDANPSSAHEGSQGKSGSKAESSRHRDVDKGRDNDSRYSDRKEGNREKEYVREERKRSDEIEKASDHHKHGNSRERASDYKTESADVVSKVIDSSGDKGSSRDDKRVDGEKSRGRSDAYSEDNKGETTPRKARDDKQRKTRERSEDLDPNAHRYSAKSYGEKTDKHRYEVDEDGHGCARDRSGREISHSKRSRSPERSGRHYKESDDHDRGFSESDTERNVGSKSKDREKENYKDDRSSKEKDNWENSKENWRRSYSRQDTKDGDNSEYDSQRREKERIVPDKLYVRAGYRKENRGRPEYLKASSNSGAMHDNSDSIEIRPNQNFDFGREETIPPSEEEWDDVASMDQGSGRNPLNSPASRGRGQSGPMNINRTGSGQSLSSGMHHRMNNQGSNSFNRAHQQGPKGGRPSRGRGRPIGRDSQRVGVGPGLPLPMLAPPFGHINLPPGPVQPVGPNLTHSPGPPLPSSVFIPPFPGPLLWPGARGIDMNMNMLAVAPNLNPIPSPGPGGPRFGPNMGNVPNHPMFFNQQGAGRGVPPNLPGPMFNPVGPISHDVPNEKPPSGWNQNRNTGHVGKAPSRGEQNDYSQNFVDTGMRPQNFIRELELTSVVEDYPKLRELIQRKDEIVAKVASTPMYYKCDLKKHVLTPEFFGTKFDVILVDPPWEEYVHRAPGVTDHLEHWTFEEIQNLKLEAIADTPSFLFLWVGDGEGLELGRQCFKKWGFRRCEDICWVKTNKKNATSGLRHDSHTLLQHSKEHCLMGIKGTVRRSTDGHIIHANIDTDIIIAEEPTDGSTKKPDDMYRIIEHFALGKRRLELFGEDHNIRSGWLTVGKGLSSSNFNSEAYIRNFSDKDGKVWQGGGGRNPPPEALHLVLTTPEIEGLRPKSPPAKSQQQQQQQQQQSMSSISIGNSNNRRAPENPSFMGMGHDPSSSEPSNQVPWANSPMMQDDKFFDGYGFNPAFGQVVGDRIEIDPHRTLNMDIM